MANLAAPLQKILVRFPSSVDNGLDPRSALEALNQICGQLARRENQALSENPVAPKRPRVDKCIHAPLVRAVDPVLNPVPDAVLNPTAPTAPAPPAPAPIPTHAAPRKMKAHKGHKRRDARKARWRLSLEIAEGRATEAAEVVELISSSIVLDPIIASNNVEGLTSMLIRTQPSNLNLQSTNF